MICNKQTYIFISRDVRLRETDLCRPLVDRSGYGFTANEHNVFDWRTVNEEMPFWVGKSLLNMSNHIYKGEAYEAEYEVIRVFEDGVC